MKSPYRARGGQREETERVKFLKCGGDALPCQLLGLRSLGGSCCLPLCLEAGQVLPGPRPDGILRPGGSRHAEACSGVLETWQIVSTTAGEEALPPGEKTSQWRNAARKRSGVGTESREDRARPVWPQPSGTPAPPRPRWESRTRWRSRDAAGRVPASGGPERGRQEWPLH